MRAAFPASAARRTGGAPIARRENSAAAARELAGSAGIPAGWAGSAGRTGSAPGRALRLLAGYSGEPLFSR